MEVVLVGVSAHLFAPPDVAFPLFVSAVSAVVVLPYSDVFFS